MTIYVTSTITIDERDIQEQFIHASGPGGQHVNKVATAVQLRFDAEHASLPDDVRERLKSLAGKRMTTDGVVLIEAKRYRTREQNRQDALERLLNLLRKAAQRPRPRQKTRPSRAARQRRLTNKRHKSVIKRLRHKPGLEE